MEQAKAAAEKRGSKPQRAFAGGRALFVLLWLAGPAAVAAMAAGWLPGSAALTAVILLGLCVSIAVGVLWQRSGLLARPLIAVENAGQRLALTFDDGPDPEVTPRVLEALRAAGERATFFVLGERALAHPELCRRIVEEGHELANHSFSHHWHLGLWRASRVADDLERTSRAIEAACGRRPRFFRPPAAILTPRVARGAELAGLLLCGHTVRSLDGSPVVASARILRRLRGALRPGAILLLHDGRVKGEAPASLPLLPELFEEMKRRGLRSVPLSALLDQDQESSTSPATMVSSRPSA